MSAIQEYQMCDMINIIIEYKLELLLLIILSFLIYTLIKLNNKPNQDNNKLIDERLRKIISKNIDSSNNKNKKLADKSRELIRIRNENKTLITSLSKSNENCLFKQETIEILTKQLMKLQKYPQREK